MAAVSGRNLTLSLDIELQQYAESLMVNKLGAIVAIEPATGEVLALVTSLLMIRHSSSGVIEEKTTGC